MFWIFVLPEIDSRHGQSVTGESLSGGPAWGGESAHPLHGQTHRTGLENPGVPAQGQPSAQHPTKQNHCSFLSSLSNCCIWRDNYCFLPFLMQKVDFWTLWKSKIVQVGFYPFFISAGFLQWIMQTVQSSETAETGEWTTAWADPWTARKVAIQPIMRLDTKCFW